MIAATRRWQAGLAASDQPGAAFVAGIQRAGLTYGDRPVCVSRQPLFLDAEVVRAYREALAHLRIAVRAARELLVEDGLDGRPDSLAARIGVPAEAIRLAAIDPGYDSAAVLARFDSYLAQGEDGRPQPVFIELNAESPAGMAYDEALSARFLEDPLAAGIPMRAFAPAQAAADGIVATWRRWGGQGDAPTVAIVDTATQATAAEFPLFERIFQARGLPCRVLTPDRLAFRGGRLLGDGVPLDIVYRRLLVADLLADPAPWAPLLAACEARAVCVVNSFRNSLLHGKGLFALMHEPLLHDRLPPEVVATIHRTIPWTGLLLERPGVASPERLRAAVRSRPERWALKPLAGHGGQGVVLGWETSRADWQAAVDGARAHVVQRRVEPWTLAFPDGREDDAMVEQVVSLDPFMVAGELAGFLCRLARGALANVRDGAHMVPVFELEAPGADGSASTAR